MTIWHFFRSNKWFRRKWKKTSLSHCTQRNRNTLSLIPFFKFLNPSPLFILISIIPSIWILNPSNFPPCSLLSSFSLIQNHISLSPKKNSPQIFIDPSVAVTSVACHSHCSIHRLPLSPQHPPLATVVAWGTYCITFSYLKTLDWV